jgi:hypothetical protein
MKPNHKCETPHLAMWVLLHTHVAWKNATETVYGFDFGILSAGRRNAKSGQWIMQEYSFNDARGFWRLLDQIPNERTRTYVIIDEPNRTLPLLDVFTMAYKKGWENLCAIIQNPPTILKWRRDDVTLTVIDRSQLWPGPLSPNNAGSTIPHGGASEPSKNAPKNVPKLRQSITTMQRWSIAWWDFLRTNDLGGFSVTLGTQALRVFRHRYMTTPLMIDCEQQSLRLARDGYKGARTECHQIGKMEGEFFLLDVNSMYAAVMRDMLVPCKLICYSKHVTMDDLQMWTRDRVVIAECDLETEEPAYAVRQNDRLLFPVGRFTTTLAGNEVVYAIRHGHIRAIRRAACYEAAYAFREFTQAMWENRRQALRDGRTDDATRWKTLMASFYGKWGQGGGTWEYLDDAPDGKIKSWTNIDYQTGEVTEFRQFGGIIQQYVESEESSQSIPSIAASITANARVVLWQLMCEAGRENVYYVDTDSLLVNADGFQRLQGYIQPDALGGLRLEGTYRNIDIRASKDYVFGERTRRKGIAGNAVVITDTEFEQSHVKSVAAMFRSGDMSHATDRRVRKHLTRTYDKGIVQGDGRVMPLRLEME